MKRLTDQLNLPKLQMMSKVQLEKFKDIDRLVWRDYIRYGLVLLLIQSYLCMLFEIVVPVVEVAICFGYSHFFRPRDYWFLYDKTICPGD